MKYEAFTAPAKAYGNARAADEIDAIVRQHSPLVRRIAWQVHGSVSSMIAIEDLMQSGLIALIEAARGFEERGAAFAPYAAIRVRGAMIDQLRREAKIGRSGMANRKRLSAVRRSLENRLNRRASDAEMAAEIEMQPAAYHAMVQSSEALQFDAMDEVYSDSSPWFADDTDTAEQQLIAAEMEEQLAKAISALDPRSAMVLQLYFREELNLAEIAETMDISAPRVCQIKRDALAKVRAQLGHMAEN
jgi:RNA polymerase sigma factor FliA